MEQPKYYDTVKELITATSSAYKDDVAFRVKIKSGKDPQYKDYTYADFIENVNAMGANLYDSGFKGGRIAIIGRNQYYWVVTHLACLFGGIVSVPIDKELPLGEMEDSLIRAGVDAVVFDVKNKEQIEQIKANGKTKIREFICMNEKSDEYRCVEDMVNAGRELPEEIRKEFSDYKPSGESMAILLFTSGTTSKSKAVMLSNKGLACNVADLLVFEVFDEHSTNIAFLPFHHILGSTGMLFALADGMRTVFSDGIRYIKQNLTEYGVTFFLGVPALIDKMYETVEKGIEKQGKTKTVERAKKLANFLLKFGIDIRRKLFKEIIAQMGGQLKYIISGGAPLSAAVAQGFTDLGIEIYQGYGLTETSPVLAAENKGHIRAGSIGRPLPSVQVEFRDKDEDGMGELCAKAPNVMIGYYENDELTSEVLEDGWFHTGDLGYMDKDGYIFLTGRKKDMIVLKNGKKAFPEEIEILLNKIPEIQDSFVFGEPIDGDWTDLRIAVQVQYSAKEIAAEHGELTEVQIRDLIWDKVKDVNQTIPHYKRVTDLYLTEEPFIKTTSLKIKRKEQIKKVLDV
ncbi:long-chain acyl-CoA synthetase [Ruminococcaceae bacterium KH2T8]|nr:long-chain acyl-CoA synthetase [Ruminococcaceae bacterium KH2T8]